MEVQWRQYWLQHNVLGQIPRLTGLFGKSETVSGRRTKDCNDQFEENADLFTQNLRVVKRHRSEYEVGMSHRERTGRD